MKHLEEERKNLRNQIIEMWDLVSKQLSNAGNALINNDINLAKNVIAKEKDVDSFELNIDRDCENYIALYSPVAIDLRYLLAILRINGTLERIGDFAYSIAKYTIHHQQDKNTQYVNLIKIIEFQKFFEILNDTFNKIKDAFISENTTKINDLYNQDDIIDDLYHTAIKNITNYTNTHSEQASIGISLAILARKMERIGDHCNNIVEDIIFYLDAKITKHKNN